MMILSFLLIYVPRIIVHGIPILHHGIAR